MGEEGVMATRTKGNGTAAASLKRLTKDGERLYRRLRKDAEALLGRGRRQLSEDVRLLQRRADVATRRLEASLLKRVHAASEAHVKRLERRVEALEKRLAGVERNGAPSAERGAAA
jgi:hypothetical protein